MKKKSLTAFFLVFCFLSAGSEAADVRNNDDQPYTLLIREASGDIYQIKVQAKGYIARACTECSIEVVGYGIVDVPVGGRVQITDSKLKVSK